MGDDEGKAFKPVNTNFAAAAANGQADDVESPSLSSSNALARFEFEPGSPKNATKVLMVEWEDDDTTRGISGDWEISWEGKRTVLPAKDPAAKDAATGDTPVNRLYFLLGAGVPVPTAVHLQKGTVHWRTNPLPAIFSPELGATARAAGKKGVLHTIWAKKRLQVLQGEIDSEAKENVEGVGYQMAVSEKDWIESNFGVNARPAGITIPSATGGAPSLNSPTSPRSPGGGRLMEKLKGLKLGTTSDALTPTTAPQGPPAYNPLSPESSDVAVGSFGAFAALKGMPEPSTLSAKPAQPPTSSSAPQPARRIAAQRPPESFAAQQRQAGMGSLNALAGDVGFTRPPPASEQADDDLFALPMSPRSPEMTKSPFSFAASDTSRYLKGETAS